jgi:phosphatidate cytidylyltransferase
MSDYPTAHIPRVAGVRPARHRRPAPGDADAVDLSALLAEYRQVAGQRRHHRRAAPETATPAPAINGTDVLAAASRPPTPRTTHLPAAAPAKSRAGRNLPAAIGVSLGLGAAIIASLFVYRPSFVGIAILAVAVGIY